MWAGKTNHSPRKPNALQNKGSETRYLSSTVEGLGWGGERNKQTMEDGRQRVPASNWGFQDNGKLMQEINLSHNGHSDCQRQGPAHWKSELLKYMISVLFHAHFHATPFGGGHLLSH